MAKRSVLVVTGIVLVAIGLVTPTSSLAEGNAITIVDGTNRVLGLSSIAVGSDGLPIVSYHIGNPSRQMVVHCSNSACSSSDPPVVVDTGTLLGARSSIALGSDGLPLVSYSSGSSLTVMHCGTVSCSSGNTVTPIGGAPAVYSDIAIGIDGLPVIVYSYESYPTRGVGVVHCGNAACTSGNIGSLVDAGSGGFADVSIAVGSDGFPIVSYWDSNSGDLEVAHCGNLTCSSSGVVTVTSAGANTAIAIGPDGLPLISYYDYIGDDLKVAHCGTPDCTSGNSLALVDSQDTVGWETSIAIGTDGLPIVSYLYATYGELRLVHCGNAYCSGGNVITTADNTPYKGTGFGSSITIGADALPVVSYLDITNNFLKVLHCSSVSCTETKFTPTPTSTVAPQGTATPQAVGGYAMDSPSRDAVSSHWPLWLLLLPAAALVALHFTRARPR